MKWTDKPDGPGTYHVVFRGSATVAVYEPHKLADGTESIYPVEIVGSDAPFMVAEFTAWCRVADLPALPRKFQKKVE